MDEKDAAWYAERDGVWRGLGIAAPARRALVNAGLLTVSDVAKLSPTELASLHGMGPKTLKILGEFSRGD